MTSYVLFKRWKHDDSSDTLMGIYSSPGDAQEAAEVVARANRVELAGWKKLSLFSDNQMWTADVVYPTEEDLELVMKCLVIVEWDYRLNV